MMFLVVAAVCVKSARCWIMSCCSGRVKVAGRTKPAAAASLPTLDRGRLSSSLPAKSVTVPKSKSGSKLVHFQQYKSLLIPPYE
ncbi:hypothetical protein LR48_Vigan07g130900 [Vigna angularis]|uniref:Secreted protein n=1 Tax=Phaseolus angularis TaxID=3914 RepID=A0A0L9UXM6_PHAAN|nr:hypothetical protein LR48_Vigan07g130900 [Vigna angularis]